MLSRWGVHNVDAYPLQLGIHDDQQKHCFSKTPWYAQPKYVG